MTSAEVRDCGTYGRVQPVAPGTDTIIYREIDCEEGMLSDRRNDINAAIIAAAQPLTMRPWPAKMPGHVWVDYVDRYANFSVQLENISQHVESTDVDKFSGLAPGGDTLIREDDVWSPGERNEACATRMRRPDEVRAGADVDPTEWIRVRMDVEYGNVGLKEPLHLFWEGLQNSQFLAYVPDNDLFVPFDLRYPDRYKIVDDNLNVITNGEWFANMPANSHWVLLLRPRRWRWFVRVWAHYVYVSWFEEVLNDEHFLKIFYDRPPFFPIRHDVLHTSLVQGLWHPYEKVWCSWDTGIQEKWLASRACIELRYQILQQQWWALCMAYLLIGVEPAVVTIQREPPRRLDIVAGFVRVDGATGAEHRVWVQQYEDMTSIYPRTYIGDFWSDFYI